MSYADTLKALLAKKNDLDNPKGAVKDQVASNKPGKKSAGRGR